MKDRTRRPSALALLLALALPAARAFLVNPIDVISRDFAALTTKVTARHILLPKSVDVALALKQRIRNEASPHRDSGKSPTFIVDAFSAAARKYSRDDATAADGGLLGVLAPQGHCRVSELDEACFGVPLGEVCGPVESDLGYHLLLVVERTNCPELDGEHTRIERGADGAGRVFSGEGDAQGEMMHLAGQQLGFWTLVVLAGGVTAEVAAAAASAVGAS